MVFINIFSASCLAANRSRTCLSGLPDASALYYFRHSNNVSCICEYTEGVSQSNTDPSSTVPSLNTHLRGWSATPSSPTFAVVKVMLLGLRFSARMTLGYKLWKSRTQIGCSLSSPTFGSRTIAPSYPLSLKLSNVLCQMWGTANPYFVAKYTIMLAVFDASADWNELTRAVNDMVDSWWAFVINW